MNHLFEIFFIQSQTIFTFILCWAIINIATKNNNYSIENLGHLNK